MIFRYKFWIGVLIGVYVPTYAQHPFVEIHEQPYWPVCIIGLGLLLAAFMEMKYGPHTRIEGPARS
jgi:hypothetical protein